jgi:putative two-component system response regulator
MSKHLVFVDDEPNVLVSYRRMLRPFSEDWQMSFYDCPVTACEHLLAEGADAVIVDIRMPRMTGLELLERLQRTSQTRGIPVIIVTGEADHSLKRTALSLGASDLLNKPVDIDDLLARLRNALRLKDYQDELRRSNELLEDRVRERTAQLEASQLTVIWRLGKAAEFRDEETGNHILRVGCYARLISEELGLPSEFTKLIYLAAPLHDIGKIGIPDAILLKPGKLDPAEWQLMQRHCEIGASILSDNARMSALWIDNCPARLSPWDLTGGENPTLALAASIALSHHEKWNGQGYPQRLSAEQIPLAARIVAICDVFDALRSERPYKRKYSLDETLEVLFEGRGSHFDPVVYEAFMNALPEIVQNEQRLSDHEVIDEVEADHEACTVCRR